VNGSFAAREETQNSNVLAGKWLKGTNYVGEPGVYTTMSVWTEVDLLCIEFTDGLLNNVMNTRVSLKGVSW
jgi:hypothetical protein